MTWGELAHQVHSAAVPRRMAHRWARPNHLLQIDAVGDWFGSDGDMVPPTRAEAMSVPAMARARHIIATPARLPLRVDPSDYPYQSLVLQPDQARTRQAVIAATLDDLLFDGVSVWRITSRYAHDSRPRHAEHIPLPRLARDSDTGAWLVDERPVRDEDLIWFEGPHDGVLAFAGRALRSAVRLDRAYNSTSRTPALAFELHQTTADVLTDEEIAAMVDDARDAVASRGVLYTNNAVEFRTHSASAENLLIAGRQAAAVDIARAVGLPATILDANPPGSSGTYQNASARLREARDLGADMYASAISARLSLDDVLPHGTTCAFDWDPLLRETFKDRMDGYMAATTSGAYTIDEVRALERDRARTE